MSTEGAGPSERVREPFYAHTLLGKPPEEWQPLEEHLQNVAELAARFAEPFGAEEWGRTAGFWHDLGKYSRAFQRYLISASDGDYHAAEIRGRIDHTSAGAQHAVSAIEILGHLLAYPIAGHHSGLLDAIADGACLAKRLKKAVEPWQDGRDEPPRAAGRSCRPRCTRRWRGARRILGAPRSR